MKHESRKRTQSSEETTLLRDKLYETLLKKIYSDVLVDVAGRYMVPQKRVLPEQKVWTTLRASGNEHTQQELLQLQQLQLLARSNEGSIGSSETLGETLTNLINLLDTSTRITLQAQTASLDYGSRSELHEVLLSNLHKVMLQLCSAGFFLQRKIFPQVNDPVTVATLQPAWQTLRRLTQLTADQYVSLEQGDSFTAFAAPHQPHLTPEQRMEAAVIWEALFSR